MGGKCRPAYHVDYYAKNKDRIKERFNEHHREKTKIYQAAYYASHQAALKLKSKEWGMNNSEKRKNSRLLKSYGITLTQYNSMLSCQDGKCKLCGKKATLVLDHCHKTGRIRGFLCHGCNLAIASLGDSLEGVMRAIVYLEST